MHRSGATGRPLTDRPVRLVTHGIAGVGIVGGLLAIFAFGRKAFGESTFAQLMTSAAVVGIGFGIAALIAENIRALLVPMVAGIVVVWLLGAA